MDANIYFSEQVKTGIQHTSPKAREVVEIIRDWDLIHEERLDEEVFWFFNHLGLHPLYYTSTPTAEIARHIVSLYAAKVSAQTKRSPPDVHLASNDEGFAMYAIRTPPQGEPGGWEPIKQLEYKLEQQYLGEGYQLSKKSSVSRPWRLSCYRTTGTVSEASTHKLQFYLLTKPSFSSINSSVSDNSHSENADSYSQAPTLEEVADPRYLELANFFERRVLQELLAEAFHPGPISRLVQDQSSESKILAIVYRHGTTHSFLSGVSSLIRSYGVIISRKHVEQFSNGLTALIFYILPGSVPTEHFHDVCCNIHEELSFAYILPRTALTPLFSDGALSLAEVTYAYCLWKFAHQFLVRTTKEYSELASTLKSEQIDELDDFRRRVRKETIPEATIKQSIFKYPGLIKELFTDLKMYHFHNFQRHRPLQFRSQISADSLNDFRKKVDSELDFQIFSLFLLFNRHLLKTNFFKPRKVALSFRLDPHFLAINPSFSNIPFAVFFIIGSEFRGFHVRFRDISRGGIRVIKSNTREDFAQNVSTLFQENYNLAFTQQRKNKDIPEGGSKGTILLSLEHQDKAFHAFAKYTDAVLDLCLPTPDVIDHYQKEELLFFGPDENTADFMNWASQRARQRGAQHWKGFTTGKTPSTGGIPHDLFGMTTRGVHQYVLCLMEKFGKNEAECTKFQMGGPDGDLGSNEIKMSRDLTIGVVDKQAVLYDPKGLDREELVRLARNRITVDNFDVKRLSPQGFLVTRSDKNITLPDGTFVPQGDVFKDEFVLNPLSSALFFVPCGGRADTVHAGNVRQLFDQTGEPRFKYIVEGANVFFTTEARQKLEKKGVIIIKDASANKGGVTSSSLEVLAGLALSNKEFEQHMQVQKDQEPPAFYTSYVNDVTQIIERNARLEFECIWQEHTQSGTPCSQISDELSKRIVDLRDLIQHSTLYDDAKLRHRALLRTIPPTLLKLLGVEVIESRLPISYKKALFASYLASRYVYSNGLNAPAHQFYCFVEELLKSDS